MDGVQQHQPSREALRLDLLGQVADVPDLRECSGEGKGTGSLGHGAEITGIRRRRGLRPIAQNPLLHITEGAYALSPRIPLPRSSEDLAPRHLVPDADVVDLELVRLLDALQPGDVVADVVVGEEGAVADPPGHAPGEAEGADLGVARLQEVLVVQVSKKVLCKIAPPCWSLFPWDALPIGRFAPAVGPR